MYRYVFELCDFESGTEYVFLHEHKFSKDEFNTICANLIKQSVIDDMRTRELYAVNTCDASVLNIMKYAEHDNISAYFDDDFNTLDYNVQRIIELFNESGFTREIKEVDASFYANIYTYIPEKLNDLVSEILLDRCRNEKVLMIDACEKAIELVDLLEACKSKDDAIVIINQWYDKRNNT